MLQGLTVSVQIPDASPVRLMAVAAESARGFTPSCGSRTAVIAPERCIIRN
jgi:hypothetical protein